MAHQSPTDIDPEELKRAQDVWNGFTKIGKYSTYGICLSVALLALGFYAIVRAG